MEYVSDRFNTQEMCDKAVNSCFLVFDSVSDQYKTQEVYDRVVVDILC